jgi:hypothetical protein
MAKEDEFFVFRREERRERKILSNARGTKFFTKRYMYTKMMWSLIIHWRLSKQLIKRNAKKSIS